MFPFHLPEQRENVVKKDIDFVSYGTEAFLLGIVDIFVFETTVRGRVHFFATSWRRLLEVCYQ